ncbi:uncharacterized protein LOC131310183 isoform X2 [Rhododendron vialii]|uniref:uncharacterized protein LOC131310183 isoform X2 n=1 Tax=Rhododendron vialii TaxID=182163 RepID=UPI00265E6066|nr:uncharacterized protein LOC131310183 isoform X2 [Rhododendron vialii]
MERTAAAETTSSEYVRWEEVHVSSDQRKKRREEVRYYLRRRDGKSDLAVIGKQKKKGHFPYSNHHHVSSSYHYAIQDRFLRSSISVSPYSSSYSLKLRSRREVVDWLNSFVSDLPPHQSSLDAAVTSDRKNACTFDVETMKSRKLGHHTTEFSWLGSPWTCRKRRRHYPSFIRNGVHIPVHAFVYVLAEEDKRIVAYLEDMYEDSRGKKMVVVRWFHKIDEVGIILPHNYNDREIFFSLCLQDLGMECVDGLTAILSPQHYDKYLKEAKCNQLEPYVCRRQFDNDDIKPFDITQVKGYWKQEILRYMYSTSPSKGPVKSQQGLKVVRNVSEGVESRPKKRVWLSKDGGDLAFNKQESLSPYLDIRNFHGSLVCNTKNGQSATCMSGKQAILQNPPQHLARGSQVEVFSHDSGLRGCWFRALIIKQHKDKVKVQYQDIKDGDNETNYLEEWVLASKVAVPDPLGLRMGGRTTVRPTLLSNKCKTYVNSGAVVDVWWHDGWWEGIVLRKETQDSVCVYFPGEKRDLICGISDLRISEEWLGNRWQNIKERPDLVTSILSGLDTKNIMVDVEPEKATVSDEMGSSIPQKDSVVHKVKEFEVVDLSKDAMLAQLRWKSLGKRRRGNSFQKLDNVGDKNKGSPEAVATGTFDGFFIPKALKVDRDNCKYLREYPFRSSAVPPMTSLVMSM